MIILWIIVVYMGQIAVCAIINAAIGSRVPKSGLDFLKLAFLPWLLFNLKNTKD